MKIVKFSDYGIYFYGDCPHDEILYLNDDLIQSWVIFSELTFQTSKDIFGIKIFLQQNTVLKLYFTCQSDLQKFVNLLKEG